MWFGILGPLVATVGGRSVHPGGPRARATLAALLLADGRIVPVERLIDQVWGDEPPASGRNQVMIAVSVLRKALRTAGGDPDVIETVASGYRIRTVDLDAHQAELSLEQARRSPLAVKAALLRETLGLWRGQVLAGIDSQPLRAVADRWEELRLSVQEDWAEAELELGRHRELVGVLGVSVAEHPLRERIRAQLMLALHRSGRQAEALEVYDRGRSVLVEELGLEPGQVLRDMHAAILRDEPDVRWSGAEALVTAPGDESCPRVRPAQLPPAVSAFTGRRRELGALDELLDRRDGGRELPLCVVYGMAGVGKSGLAVSWAHRVADRFPDGHLFADLRGHDRHAPPLPPEAVLARFLRALGMPEKGVPAGLDERTALFRSLLEGRRVLIVLDDAASATQVRPLLAGSASCCVIVTSRSPLGGLVAQDGARCVGLDVLDPQEAEELLVQMVGAERTAGERGAVRRVGELCDRLPLALRIAAAKLMSRNDWTVSGISTRLESEQGRLDELRHAELEVRGSLARSYRDLPRAAKLAFRRLGLLDPPDGFTPRTVAALAEAPLPIAEKLCEYLVDAQLARPLGRDTAGAARYRLHDLVRLFSRERAEEEETPESRSAAVARAANCLPAHVEQAEQRDGRVYRPETRSRCSALRGREPRHQSIMDA
ncbi:AfsR/SARP family transcriptional regulator [Nonomuraea insulae]|uniref:BTAD domain-containing putative transcriptional regulator n=1 Tax=Nonomuraea insulae TaxID=1616787 RepID=A0ABW1DBD7_9ACTN